MGKDFIGHERSCIDAISPCQPIDVAGETFDQCCSHADRREVVEVAPRRHFQAGNRKGNCHPWPVSRPLDSAHAGFFPARSRSCQRDLSLVTVLPALAPPILMRSLGALGSLSPRGFLMELSVSCLA